MQKLLTWGPALQVGYPEIDDQHEYLVDLVNTLDAGYRAGYSRNILGSILSQLVEYTRFHFAFEERLMDTYLVPGTAAHKEEHERLTGDVVKFKEEFNDGKADVSMPLLRFLRDWLQEHILKTDKELAEALRAAGPHSAA